MAPDDLKRLVCAVRYIAFNTWTTMSRHFGRSKISLQRCGTRGRCCTTFYKVVCSCCTKARAHACRTPRGLATHAGKTKQTKPPKLQGKNTIIQLDTQRHLTAEYINHRRTGRERETRWARGFPHTTKEAGPLDVDNASLF